MPFKQNPAYADPKITKKVYDLKSQGESNAGIAGKLKEEFGLTITPPTIKNIYERFVAKNMVVKGVKEGKLADEVVPDYQAKMDARFDRITKVTDDLMDTLDELKKTMPPQYYIKYVPTILMVCREILNQLNFIKKEQSQVLINQKNVIYSPLQIMNILNKELPKLESEGKIIIKKIAKDGRILTEEESKHLVFSKAKTNEEIEMDENYS
jgi:hypothetical protein